MNVSLEIGGGEGDSARWTLQILGAPGCIYTSVDPFQSVSVAAAMSGAWKSFPKPRTATAGENFVSFERGAVLHPGCGWLWPEISKLSIDEFLRAGVNLSSPARSGDRDGLVKGRQPFLAYTYLSCSLIAFSWSR